MSRSHRKVGRQERSHSGPAWSRTHLDTPRKARVRHLFLITDLKPSPAHRGCADCTRLRGGRAGLGGLDPGCHRCCSGDEPSNRCIWGAGLRRWPSGAQGTVKGQQDRTGQLRVGAGGRVGSLAALVEGGRSSSREEQEGHPERKGRCQAPGT